MDYETLELHLTAGRWQEADELTRTAILTRVDRQDFWLRKEDLILLSPADIILIDRLWRNYSNNRFGFSVQARIWYASREQYQLAREAKNEEEYLEQCQSRWGTKKEQTWCINFAESLGWKCQEYRSRSGYDNRYEFQRDENISYALDAPLGNLPSTFALGGGESTHEYEPLDTESMMGIYVGDYWYYDWSEDSLIGYDFLEKFYRLFEQWHQRAISLHSSPLL